MFASALQKGTAMINLGKSKTYFVFGAAILFLCLPISAQAKERLTYVQGVKACTAWCDAHRQGAKNVHACYVQCDLYWAKNASDSASYSYDLK
jgi:hypothetical protein